MIGADSLQKAIWNNTFDPIIVISFDGVIFCLNRAAEDLLGYSSEAAIGKLTLTEIHDSEELGRTGRPDFEAVIAHARVAGNDIQHGVFVTKTGLRIPVRLHISLLYNSVKQPEGFLIIAENLSEYLKVQQIVSDVTHRLNNLITVILGRSKVLVKSAKQDSSSSESFLHGIETISAAASEIATHVKTLRSALISHEDL